jgi:hypothetical protein
MKVDNVRCGGEISVQTARRTWQELHTLLAITQTHLFKTGYIQKVRVKLFGKEFVIRTQEEAEEVLEACKDLLSDICTKSGVRIITETLIEYYGDIINHSDGAMLSLWRVRINKRNLQDFFGKLEAVPDIRTILANKRLTTKQPQK